MVKTSFDAEAERVLQEIRQHLKAERSVRALPNAAFIRQTLAHLESDTRVTARAWNRLPPVVSDRQGWQARVELWFKQKLQRATKWYSWEQVNFNAATNNALHDLHWLLTIYEREQTALRAQIKILSATVEELRANKD